MGVIFTASSLPAPELPALGADKLVHLLEYAGLTLLLVRALAGGVWSGVRPRTLATAVMVATLYGLSDEWHQTITPGRSVERADVAADVAGALLGAGVCHIIERLWRSKPSSSSAKAPSRS